MKLQRAILLSLAFTFSLSLSAEISPPDPKVARYHQLLLKRPDSKTLFERFIDSWLDHESKENLETFLSESAQAGGASEWQLLATYFDYMGQEEKALEALSQALLITPDDAALLCSRAKLKARLLDFENALLDLEQCEEAIGEEALTLRGTWLARLGKPEEAVAAWNQLLAQKPQDQELREDLVELQVDEGLYPQALETAQELAENTKDPYQKAIRLLRVADIQNLSEDRDASVVTYRKVLSMTGEDSWLEREVLAQLDTQFKRTSDTAGLRELYSSLREEHPQRVSLRKALAKQMLVSGETDEALKLFQEVIQMTPGDNENRRELVTLLEFAERYSDAIIELEVLIRDEPEKPDNYEQLARLHELNKDKKGLKSAIQKVHELRANTPAGLLSTASLYERFNLREEADALLREGLTTFPEASGISEALASFLASPLCSEEEQKEATQIWLTMAENADAEQLLRVARSLLSHRRSSEAFELLSNRIDEFPNDLLLLQQLCTAAQVSDHGEEAFPYSQRLVELAETPTDLESALAIVTKLTRQIDLEPIIENLVALPPSTATQWCLLAELQQLFGQIDESNASLAQAQILNNGPLVLTQKIRLLQSQGQLTEACQVMQTLTESPEGERPIYLRKLIKLLSENAQTDEALLQVERWKRIAPADKNAWLERARLLTEKGDLEEATEELRRATSKFDEDESLVQKLAEAFLNSGETAESRRLYRKLYDETKDPVAKSRWMRFLAQIATQDGRLNDLISEFDRRSRRSGTDIAPLLALASIHQETNDFSAEIESLQEILRRQPQLLRTAFRLADLQQENFDFDGALNTLQSIAAQDESGKATNRLVSLYFTMGDTEKGLALLRQQQAEDPRTTEKTATALLRAGQPEACLTFLTDLPRSDWRIDFLRAVSLYHLNRREEARQLLYSLATVTQEIPSLVSKPNSQYAYMKAYFQQSGLGEYTDQFMTLYASMELVEVWSSSEQQTQLSTTHLPQQTEILRNLALSLLQQEAAKSNGEEYEKLVAAIPYEDKNLTHFFLKHYNQTYGGDVKFMIEGYEKGIVPLEMLIAFGNHTDAISAELLKEAAEKFSDKKPSTASQALIKLSSMEPEESDHYLELAIAQIAQLPIPQRVNSLITLGNLALLPQLQDNDFSGINGSVGIAGPNTKSSLRKQLAKISQEATEAELKQAASQMYVAYPHPELILMADAWTQGDIETVCKYLSNPALNNFSASAYQQIMMMWNSGGNNDENPFTAPPFPSSGSDYPIQVEALITSITGSNNENGSLKSAQALLQGWQQESSTPTEGNQTGITRESLALLGQQVSSPTLQARIAHSLDNQELLAEKVAALSASKNAEAHLFAAGYYANKKEYETCYKSLVNARNLPLEKAEQKKVDGYLVFIGSQLVKEGHEPESLAHARRAGLRLSRSTRTKKAFEPLGPLLTSLGLDHLVAQRQRAFMQKNSHSGSFARSNKNSLRMNDEPKEYLDSLFEADNKEFAIHEAAKIIQFHQTNGQLGYYQTDQIKGVLAKQDVIDEVLALLSPPKSGNLSTDLPYAEICLAFEKKELVKKILSPHLKGAETPKSVVVNYLLCLGEKEQLSFLEDNELIFSSSAFAEQISSLLESDNIKVALQLAITGLNNLPSEKEKNFSGYIHLLTYLKNDYYAQDTPLEQRKHFIKILLTHKETCRQCFVTIFHSKTQFGFPNKDLPSLAVQALETIANDENYLTSLSENDWILKVGNSTISYGSNLLSPHPKDFLLQKYLENPQDDYLSSKVEELLPNANSTLEFYSNLRDSKSEEEISTILADWKKTLSTERAAKSTELGNFLSICVTSKVPTARIYDIEREFLNSLKKQQHSYESIPSLSQLFLTYDSSKRGQDYKDFIKRAFTSLIGDEEAIAQWIKLSENNSLPQKLEAFDYSLRETLEGVVTQSYSLAGILALKQHPIVERHCEHELEQAIRKTLRADTIIEAVAKLTEIDFWNLSWQELGAPSGQSDQKPLFSFILKGLSPKKTFIKQFVESSKPTTFRQHLANAILLEKKKDLARHLEDAADELASLPAAEKTGLTNILLQLYPNLKPQKGYPKTSELFVELKKARKNKTLAKLQEEAQTELYGDLHNYQFRKEQAEKIITSIRYDPDLALQLYRRTINAQPDSNNSSYYYESYSGTPLTRLFDELGDETFEQELPFLSWVNFQQAIEENENPKLLPVGILDRSTAGETTMTFWQQVSKLDKKNFTAKEKKIFVNFSYQRMAEVLPPEDDERFAYANWLVWLSATNWNLKKYGKDYWQWLDDTQFRKTNPELALHCYSLIALRIWNSLNSSQHEIAQKDFLAALRNQKLSSRFRLELACTAASIEPKLLDTSETLAQCNQLLTDYIEEGREKHVLPIHNLLSALPLFDTQINSEEWLPISQAMTRSYVALSTQEERTESLLKQAGEGLLKLNLAINNKKEIKQSFAWAKQSLICDLDFMLELALTDSAPLANQLVADPQRTYKFTIRNREDTPLWNQKLEALLPHISNETERYRISCLVNSLADKTGKHRENRETLRQSFNDDELKTNFVRYDVYRSFAESTEGTLQIAEELRAFVDKYPIVRTISFHDIPDEMSESQLCRIARRLIFEESGIGFSETGFDQIKRLAKATEAYSDDESYYRDQGISHISDILLSIFNGTLVRLCKNSNAGLEESELTQLKELYRLQAQTYSKVEIENEYESYLCRSVALPYCLFAMQGLSADFVTFVRALPKEEQKLFDKVMENPTDLITRLSPRTNYWREGKYRTRNKKFLTHLLQDKNARETIFENHFSSSSLHLTRSFHRDDVNEILSALADRDPTSLRLRLEAAISTGRTDEKKLEESISTIEALIKKPEVVENEELLNLYRGELAVLIGNYQKKPAKAHKLASQVDLSFFPEERRKKITNFFKKFEKQASNKTP